ncbi:hypothetical protein [Winogradskyella thalassocola]|uniref:Cthe-2314-like HEPN domain-containing protein n=1 Tax=Winogradskyella thalassocola TaxID=262004 RepID=A0A1G7ZNA1_9FLAO|nr:hypothetical protein [Winogradskyella thalassocola]SDH10047.1 hypothetical protein SAMN04489796_1011384 [Winogradskyella thalassocola]
MSEEREFIVGGTYNWYDQNVAAGIDLIEAFIEQCEISNSFAITEYHKYKQVEIEEYEHGASISTHFRLIDGDTFNAEDIMINVFPNMNRHSTLVLIMSMFEKILKNLCDRVNTLFELNKPFKKVKPSLLLSIKYYLTNEANLESNEILEKQWSDLMCLQSIRNNITHNFGYLEEGNKYVTRYIDNNKNLSLAEDNEFLLNHEFLKDLIPNFRSFCLELQQAIRDKSKRN